jgi:hypothetical protein
MRLLTHTRGVFTIVQLWVTMDAVMKFHPAER